MTTAGRQTSRALLAVTLIYVVGCETEKQPALLSTPAPGSIQRPPPEESFRGIVGTIRRAVASEPGGFFDDSDDAFSRLTFHREVDDKLIPPTDGSDLYKGQITVTTRYSYSYRPALEDDEAGDEADNGDSSIGLNDPGSRMDVDNPALDPLRALDQELTDPARQNRAADLLPKTATTSTEDEEVKDFELDYVNGRWVLSRKPDLETDEQLAKAFEFALKRQ
jgi:hypothetical protein